MGSELHLQEAQAEEQPLIFNNHTLKGHLRGNRRQQVQDGTIH